MSVPDDVYLLARRIDALTRAATNIRRHLPDLHILAYEPGSGDDLQIRTSRVDYTPRAGDPKAQHLWSRTSLQVGQVEDMLIGLERQLRAYFLGAYTSPEPSRGFLRSAEDFDDAVAARDRRRERGEFTPAPLIDQPPHPGRRP